MRAALVLTRYSRDAVTQRHALLRDAVTQRDVVTSFRFRTVTGLLEARRFDVEILDRRGGLHHDCYFVTRLFAISSSHGSLGSGHFATLARRRASQSSPARRAGNWREGNDGRIIFPTIVGANGCDCERKLAS
jgi:hypothetical protein